MNSRYLLTVVALCSVIFVVALPSVTHAKPMDLYDEMSDLLDEMQQDDSEPRTSARLQPESFCKMPTRRGVCRALIPRWSYDPSTQECREFRFGGCDGNPNNFGTYKQCMQTCQGF